MDYRFLCPSDDELICKSELPVEGGIAVAIRSTGYDAETDEVLEMAIVDFDGNQLFAQAVKPQNVEEWPPSDATGGIVAADVQDAPELYQFEEQISELFENATVVVGAHMPYIESMVESSWVTLPDFEKVDVIAEFLASHDTSDYPRKPATVASLQGIADYFGLDHEGTVLVDSARCVAASYRALVGEFAAERAAKGTDYWQRHEERKAAEMEQALANDRAYQNRERFLNRMNGALWLAGAIIFTSLVIQMYQRQGDMGLMIVFGAAAVFALSRSIVNFRK